MIRGYLRFRRALFSLYLLVAITFPFIQSLYGLPLSSIGYGLLIITFLLAIFIAWDLYRYTSRVRALDAVLQNLSDARHALPEAIGPIEDRYHALAAALYEALSQQADTLSRAHIDQVDYYTMWLHQIKTPIAAMRLALASGESSALLEEELFKIERYVEMALQFVKMGDLSSDLVVEEYPLSPIVSACVKKYGPLFIGRRLKVEIDPINLTVVTDSKWLAFIIEQLLSNAVKYTNRGGVHIYAQGHALVIEDTGIGIRSEDILRIFQKGYTGFNGRMEQRASGLGLFMASRVAKQLGIHIYPESTLGKGTQMTIVFPQKDSLIQ